MSSPAGAAPVEAPATAPDAQTAARLAADNGARVEVLSERTEYDQVFAEPDGHFTAESAVEPQRVRRADGSWSDVDLTLAAGPDGLLRPRASVADVRFSAGGTDPLATVVKEGKKLTVTWPLGALPEPITAGNAATYPSVLPDVDLVARATPDGFAHVLVVKTAAAAADERLQQITFDLGGEARVRKTHDGDLTAVAAGTTVASASQAAMWDSRRVAPAAGSRTLARALAVEPAPDGGSSDPSSPAKPADAARIAVVGTTVDGDGDLVLKPDVSLLANATFPLFIDPAWSTGKSRWAYSTNNNSNNTDLSVARVGKDPNSGVVYRSYFEFPTTALKGKYIHDAYVQMKVDHTWSCTNTPNTMFSSKPISGTPRSAWKASGWYLKMLAQVSSHANEGSGCSDSPQPDVTVNFNTDAVKATIQGGANAGSSSATFVFSAVNSAVSGESTQDRWKKYFPGNAKLITDFDNKPGTPTEFYVNGVRCGSGTLGIGTTAVKFSAKLPDADKTQAIKATWEWQRLNGTTWTAMTAPAVSSTAANTVATSSTLSGAVDGQTYRYHVKGTDPSPYNQSSAFSAWCQFRVDTSDPTVTATVSSQPAGPGRPGQFTITSSSADVTKFRYGWNAAVTEVAPSSSSVTDGVTTKSVTVNLTPPKYGTNTLYLQAIDATGNVGDGSLTFDVATVSGPVAVWGLESYPGVSTTDALADQQPTLAGNTPLTANGVTFTDKQRIVGGTAVTLTGAGDLTTAGPVVDTTKSYAAAAWVRLDATTGFQSIVAQDAVHNSTFQLQFRSDDRNGDGTADKSFCFTIPTEDVARSVCGVNTAVAGRWTHVAGAFDAAEKEMRVWVDGVLKQEGPAPDVAVASNGVLRIGDRLSSDTQPTVDRLSGAVADVQVFDRTLVQEDFTGDVTDPADAVEKERGMVHPVEVASWDFEVAVECYDPTIEGTCQDSDGTRFGRRLALSKGVMVGSGPAGRYGAFDDTFPDDSSGTTREYGWSQKSVGDPAWQDSPVLRTDQSFTVTASVHLDSVDATMTAIAPKGSKQSAFYVGTRQSTVDNVAAQRFEVMVPSADAESGVTQTHIIAPEALGVDDAGAWHQLTVVYDAGSRTMKLYVNGVPKASAVLATSLWNATGPMLVGNSWRGSYADAWFGGIDDVHVYQGAMTDAQVAAL